MYFMFASWNSAMFDTVTIWYFKQCLCWNVCMYVSIVHVQIAQHKQMPVLANSWNN